MGDVSDRTGQDLVVNSSLYREFRAEREEILRHKWIESEKAGYDIGLEHSLIDWIIKHRSNWRRWRREHCLECPYYQGEGRRMELAA